MTNKKGKSNMKGRTRDPAESTSVRYRRSAKGVAAINNNGDDDDDGDECFENDYVTLQDYLSQLSKSKKSSVREEVLSGIVKVLKNRLQNEFVQNNFATLLYNFLHCIRKKGFSNKELQLAFHAIGLLAMTLDCKDDVHEVYTDSLPILSQALKSLTETLKVQILDCLAMVTFFGANNSKETEATMQIIWEFMNPDSADEVVKKYPTAVLVAAISSWSFLLTTMERWGLNHKYWQGAVSYFSNLLHEDDESMHVAAGEALALIFEIDCLEKFSSAAHISFHQGDTSLHSIKPKLKNDIAKQLRCHSMKAWNEDSTEQETIRTCKSNLDALKYFESSCLESVVVDGIELSTWSKKIKLNFIKHSLGEDGFKKHMRENEQLHDTFKFKPKSVRFSEKVSLYQPEREEVTIQLFQPHIARLEDSSMLLYVSSSQKQKEKRLTKSSNSSLHKARTKLRNKQRMLSQEDNAGYFLDDDGTQMD